jgi:hypothetical protein
VLEDGADMSGPARDPSIVRTAAVGHDQVDVADCGVANQKTAVGMIRADPEWPRAAVPVSIDSGEDDRRRSGQEDVDRSANVETGCKINSVAVTRRVSGRGLRCGCRFGDLRPVAVAPCVLKATGNASIAITVATVPRQGRGTDIIVMPLYIRDSGSRKQ